MFLPGQLGIELNTKKHCMIYYFNTLIVDFNDHVFDIFVPWGKYHIMSFLYI